MEQGNRKGTALVFPVVTGLGITVLLPHGSVNVGSGAIICRDGGEVKVNLETQVQMWWATEPTTLACLRCVGQANIQT